MAKQRTYKDIRTELDTIMQKFESSAHDDVDEMLKDHSTATDLLAELDSYLKAAEVKLNKYKSD
jgi:exonuclease VII small subunit